MCRKNIRIIVPEFKSPYNCRIEITKAGRRPAMNSRKCGNP
jgi:hypothetical protein